MLNLTNFPKANYSKYTGVILKEEFIEMQIEGKLQSIHLTVL